MKRLIIGLLLIFFVVTSCEKKASENQLNKLYESYFDVSPGRFIVYDVFEVIHDETAAVKHDTLNYQLKTVVGDSIIDNEGRLTRKFLRYKRVNSNGNWVLSDAWVIFKDNKSAFLVEENETVIKMMFPIAIDTKWNANVFNTKSAMNCYYDNIHAAKTIKGLDFDSTVLVEQENERNLIEYKRKYEVSANHVGLIRMFYKDLKISNFDTLNIKSGKEVYFEVANYGYE